MAPMGKIGKDAEILWAAHTKHMADPIGPSFYSQYFERMRTMRIYRVISTISVPDDVKPEDLETILDHSIGAAAGGKTVGRIICELSDDTLPTPEVPVETLQG